MGRQDAGSPGVLVCKGECREQAPTPLELLFSRKQDAQEIEAEEKRNRRRRL